MPGSALRQTQHGLHGITGHNATVAQERYSARTHSDSSSRGRGAGTTSDKSRCFAGQDPARITQPFAYEQMRAHPQDRPDLAAEASTELYSAPGTLVTVLQ
jgi:hypothetical protein